MQIELKVLVTMTAEQMVDYADEFGLDPSDPGEIVDDVVRNVRADVKDMSGLFWTAEAE